MYGKFLSLAAIALLSVTGAQASYFGALQAPQNQCFMGSNGAGTGTASFRALVAADIPALPYASSSLATNDFYIGVGGVATAQTGTQATALLSVMVGDAGAGGTKGLVPAPATGDATKVLSGAGTWIPAASGSVTAVSVSSSNGFAGSSSGGATPALTISTTVTAPVLKGNGTAISAASEGTDYQGAQSVVAKTTTYTAVRNDVVMGDATGAAFTVTIPAAASNVNAQIKIVKVDSSANAITLSRSGADKITGQNTVTLPAQYDSVILVSDGVANWYAF